MGIRRVLLQSVEVVIALLFASAARESRGAPPLAEIIASVPNRVNPWAAEANPLPPIERLLGVDQQFWVKVGPPEASLSVSVVESRAKLPSPRGTILVLHGVLDRSAVMLPAARALADAGYRAVLVDLRGRGRSTGKYMTFGIQEAKDLSQVIDALRAKGPGDRASGRLRHLLWGHDGDSPGRRRSPRTGRGGGRAFQFCEEEVPHFARMVAPGVGA